jgi:transcriptional regulator with PAS, ATPase and Fis domain
MNDAAVPLTERVDPAVVVRAAPLALFRRDRALRIGSESATVLGVSPAFREALNIARRVALTNASVFITGESGTGKECMALFIHRQSERRAAPFVPVNCAALPEGLLESELFGHRRGAFTGAVRDKPGIFEAAHTGTILLDELLDMPKAIQAKLLRVLQDGVVRRVGSEGPGAAVDVRIISATNREPAAAIREGVLREDLYYRLDVVPLHLPPLRERPEDIPILAEHFLKMYWIRHRGAQSAPPPPPTFSPEALWALGAHPWRGNVRELQNTIEHLVVVLEPGATVRADQIPFREDPAVDPARPAQGDEDFRQGYRAARRRVLAAFEASYLDWFYRRAGHNISRAARHAGIDRTTLYRLLERREGREVRDLSTDNTCETQA